MNLHVVVWESCAVEADSWMDVVLPLDSIDVG